MLQVVTKITSRESVTVDSWVCEQKERALVPSKIQFLHGSAELLLSHLHFDLRHWSHALLLRLRTCLSPAFIIPFPDASTPELA